MMKIHIATSDDNEGIAALYNALSPNNLTTASDIAEGDKRRDPKFK